MYKITLHYQTEKIGVYSSEEITTSTSVDFQREWMKVLRKWTKKVIPELSFNQIKKKSEDVLQVLIKSKLEQLNKDYPGECKRSFSMSVHVCSIEEKYYHPAHKNIYDLIYNSDDEN